MKQLRPLWGRIYAFWKSTWVVWRRESGGRVVTVELRQRMPGLVFLVLLGWYIAAPSEVVAFSLAVITGVIGFSLLWAREMGLRVTGYRKLRYAAMQVGDELEEEVGCVNASFLPVLWAEYVDRSNLPGYTVSSVRSANNNQTQRWRVHTICTRRGVFHLGPWELRLGDVFGLFLVRVVYTTRQEILVYPPLAALPAEIMPHRGAQGDHRPLNQPLSAETVDSLSVRLYQSGDPLRHIHWKTTARRIEPYVKVFEPEAASRMWILPDMDASVQCGQGDDSSLETAVMLAASLAARLLQDKLAVGVFVGGDAPQAKLPQSGQAYLWELLQYLAPLQPQENASLRRTLEQIRPLINARDLLVIITPSLDLEWLPALQNLRRTRRGDSANVVLLDPASFGEGQSAQHVMNALNAAGLSARLVQRGDIQPLKGVYGSLSRWEFMTLGTGRAVARSAPRLAALVMAGQRPGDDPGKKKGT